MGQAIEEIALDLGHEVVGYYDSPVQDTDILEQADVAIEFSVPQGAVHNITKCIEVGCPLVVGTTGWYNQYDEVVAKVKANGSALLTATNFSIGVNLFFEVNRYLAEMMNEWPDYGVDMEEVHHMQKLDHPSGTAITLAEGILKEIKRKKRWVGQLEDAEVSTTDVDLKITSLREPHVPGTHSIRYGSDIDEIVITHRAKNRKGFAGGAVTAAEWLVGKEGVFTMKDVLNLK